MPIPMVSQLRFTRSEFVRCLEGVSAEDAVVRLPPMNCISWMIGHLASQEQFYWVESAQDKVLVPGLSELVGFGSPASTPPLDDMWSAWHEITAAADVFLDELTPAMLDIHLNLAGNESSESCGIMLLRNIYHYSFHTGEAHAVRQMLGHKDLPQFVGNMDNVAYC